MKVYISDYYNCFYDINELMERLSGMDSIFKRASKINLSYDENVSCNSLYRLAKHLEYISKVDFVIFFKDWDTHFITKYEHKLVEELGISHMVC